MKNCFFDSLKAQWAVGKRLVILLLLLEWTGLLMAQPTNDPQILFLHLKLKNKNVSLVNTTTVPGVVKPPRVSETGIQYELISTTGESLWKGTIADPSVRHVEAEAPPGSGNLKRKTIHFDEAEFTLRAPVLPAAQRIDFYVLEPAAPDAKQTRTKKSLGSVVLPSSQSPQP